MILFFNDFDHHITYQMAAHKLCAPKIADSWILAASTRPSIRECGDGVVIMRDNDLEDSSIFGFGCSARSENDSRLFNEIKKILQKYAPVKDMNAVEARAESDDPFDDIQDESKPDGYWANYGSIELPNIGLRDGVLFWVKALREIQDVELYPGTPEQIAGGM